MASNAFWTTGLGSQPGGPNLHRFHDDFNGVAIDATNAWTVIKDAGATAGIVADTAGGELALTSTATTENDGASIQGNEVWLPATNRVIGLEWRIKIATAAQIDAFIGLGVNFATDPEAALIAANRIGFQIDDGSAVILCKTESGGTETSNSSTISAVDATYIRLGLLIEGTGSVKFYVDRILRRTHTTNIPATELALAAAQISGQATGTQALTIDYVTAVATR